MSSIWNWGRETARPDEKWQGVLRHAQCERMGSEPWLAGTKRNSTGGWRYHHLGDHEPQRCIPSTSYGLEGSHNTKRREDHAMWKTVEEMGSKFRFGKNIFQNEQQQDGHVGTMYLPSLLHRHNCVHFTIQAHMHTHGRAHTHIHTWSPGYWFLLSC